MNHVQQAQSAYAAAAGPARSPRSVEFDAFARVTRKMSEASRAGAKGFPPLASALHENRRLWTVLASSVADRDNALPNALRARILYLAEFTQTETTRILAGEAEAAALIDINTAIMQGLRTEAQGQ